MLKLNLHELELLLVVYSIKNPVFLLKLKNNLKEEYFEDSKLGKIFKVVSSFHDKYNKVPTLLTLKTIFKKRFLTNANDYIDLIKQIYSWDQPYDYDYIEENTINFIKQAKVIEAIRNSIPKINEGKYDNIYNDIKNAIILDFDKDLGVNFVNDAVQIIKSKGKDRISTGYVTLDRITGRGFEGSCVYVFSGIYGIGKSIWLQNIALKQLMNNKNVVYYTLELSSKSVIKRLISIYTSHPQNEFLNNINDIEKQLKILKMITKCNLWIKEFPTGVANINDFRSHLEELKTTTSDNPDIIIIDYCNIMSTLEKISYENMYSRTKKLYEEVRSLSQEYDVPIITAAQINRGGMDERKGGTKQLVTGANISDSFGINQTADVHFIINQTTEEKEQGIMRLYVDKNRQGPDKFTKDFYINYNNLKIEDIVDEQIKE